MKTLPTTLPGVVLLELDVFGDHRGRFMETYRRERYVEMGVGVGLEFVQDNYSTSVKGTLRGLHQQLHHPQGKLVCVLRGEVWDVAVDIRRGSPTFGQWFGTYLSADNHRQMWIPPGFAHGFLVTSESADFIYKCTASYVPSDERAIKWDDPDLAIDWPLARPTNVGRAGRSSELGTMVDGAPILSARDQAAPLLRDAELPTYKPAP